MVDKLSCRKNDWKIRKHIAEENRIPSFVIPRVKKFKSLLEVLQCWWIGGLPKIGIYKRSYTISLYKPFSASDRKQAWTGATDKWLKESGNKSVYARIKRIVLRVQSHLKSEEPVASPGCDKEWLNAVKCCAEEIGSKPLSSL